MKCYLLLSSGKNSKGICSYNRSNNYLYNNSGSNSIVISSSYNSYSNSQVLR